jgi:hypothetical protein
MLDELPNVQLAKAALQLLNRAQIQMHEIDIAMAVRNWLAAMANPQPMSMPLNGGEERLQAD